MVIDGMISAGHERSPNQTAPRLRLLGWLLVAVFSITLARSFYLQIIRGERFQLQAEENRVVVLPRPAPRGIIYDSQNQPLLTNVASTNVYLDPQNLPTEENETHLFDLLPNLLPIEPEVLRERLTVARSQRQPVLLSRALNHDEVITLESRVHELPGVRLSSATVRSYPLGAALAPILGYTGHADEVEVQQRPELLPGEVSGKAGVEKYYDVQLRGRSGAAFQEVDAAQRPQKEIGEYTPLPGEDLFLTIDAQFQQHIFSLLEARAAAARTDEPPVVGSVIALEPETGAVRALVSYPSFDPNIFSQPGLRSGAADILADPRQPLFNRAVSGTYAPGSTIKPLLAAAGLAEGIITRETTWLSSGGIRIGQWFFPDWKAGGHGLTNVTKALAESVNTFFYIVAGGDETRPGLGIERVARSLREFSLGVPTGIDLPGEAEGLVPTPDWKVKTKGERWYIGDTYHLAIGQGDVLVTPLQVAVATAAIANGGRVVTPHVVATEHAGSRTLGISDRHLAVVREGMRAAVTGGSARRLARLPIPLAGKTGTAQVGGSDLTNAWFTSFGPYDNPSLVVTVLLEGAGEGDDVAVPLAEEIWRWWAKQR